MDFPYSGIQGIVPPTTTSTTTCSPSYQSVTLETGQSFILPPGATIISATNPSAIQSDCADLSNLEQLECFILPMIVNDQAGDGETSPWEANENFNIDGISVNGIFYAYNPGIGAGGDVFMGNMRNFIATHPVLQNILLNLDHCNEGSDRGGIATLCFKTIPEIAKTVYIQCTVIISSFPDDPITSNNRMYAIPYANYNRHCKCGCS